MRVCVCLLDAALYFGIDVDRDQLGENERPTSTRQAHLNGVPRVVGAASVIADYQDIGEDLKQVSYPETRGIADAVVDDDDLLVVLVSYDLVPNSPNYFVEQGRTASFLTGAVS